MSVIQALAYLWAMSAKNRIRTRLRRLRQPKYLVGGIVGLVYLWAVFLRNIVGGRFGSGGAGAGFGMAPEWIAGMEVAGAWVLLLLFVGFWIIPSRRAALDFSQAEVQFLFAAPVSRRGLLHYKLASWQAGLLFTSVLVSLFSGRLVRADGAWMSILGWWMALLLLQLHSLGASFVRTWLLDRGVAHARRRLVVAGCLGGIAAAALAWAWRAIPERPGSMEDVEAWFAWWVDLSGTRPIRELLTPLRWIARLAITRDPVEFAGLAGVVLLLVALHYFWIVRATVAFEEASVEASRLAAAAAARVGSRGGRIAGARGGNRAPLAFSLKPVGPVWVGLAWKNLAAAGDWFRGRTPAVVAGVVGLLAGAGLLVGLGEVVAATVGAVALILWIVSIVLGPSGPRGDLRQELSGPGWEVLKSMPLTGSQIVAGELLASWGVLGAIQLGLSFCVVGYLPAPPSLGEVGVFERGSVFAAMAVIGPAVTLLGLCLQNGAALLFPAWVLSAPGQARGGFEVLGQRMIVYLAQMLGLILALIPAVVAGALVYVGAGWLLGRWMGFGLAAGAAAGVLLAESACLVVALGWIWDRTDLARERTG